MENNILRQFSINYKQIIIDEIALEGLEGIGLDLLWRRVEKRVSAEITEKMKERFWNYIINNSSLSFYELPEPFPYLELIDRFVLIDEDTGHLEEPDDYLDGPYEYTPIENEYGSCQYYYTRKPITEDMLQEMSYTEVVLSFGDKLAIVASIEERWHALAPHMPITCLSQMMNVNYCLLELIGKSRENGQMSVGKSNLHKIIKDSKTLFYNRKHLDEMDLIKLLTLTQVIKGRGVKCLLIRLKRFHKPSVLSMPKVGMLHNIIDYLLKAPGYCERTELLVKKGVLTQKQNRRLQKTVNIFTFEDREIKVDDHPSKGKKTSVMKRKYISLSSKSDSSDTEEETTDAPLACQYKIGLSLMRQAYEQFLRAGLQGLTQMQMSHLLGIEFYTARAICRIFRLRNIVREYLEDKGKQRTARFIAVVATETMDKKYEEQKELFQKYLELPKGSSDNDEDTALPESTRTSTSDDEYNVPLKKIKIEQEAQKTCSETTEADIEMTPGNEITEIKVLDGFENAKTLGSFKKNPTLRQLKFANGMLKVLNEKLCISGYMTLSNLASKEVNEPTMDTKALKCFMQKLVNDGHIKMFKIKWPGLQRYSILICARHVKITDPIIRAKYKEICLRAIISKKTTTTKKEEIGTNPTPAKMRCSYPRYMKIQKLHEFIMDITYFNYVKPESHSLPRGFVCAIDLIPEATVQFLINNLCTTAAIDMYQLVTDSQLPMKLKDAPPNVYTSLMKSKVVQNSIRINLKVLAMLGLIQLVSHQTAVTNNAGISNYSSFLFYVNRHGKILNTAGSWPRNRQDVKELSFYFETHEDVVKYWTEVCTISTNTEVIVPGRGRKQLQAPLRTANEVKAHDLGERHGDGLGPCGFDSCFYMEIPRLWQTFYARPGRKMLIKKKTQLKRPKLDPIKKVTKSKPKHQPPKIVPEKPILPLKRKRPDGSVKWSKHEDLIITICKAAITIMSPNSQPGSLIVRNIVAKDLLSSNDPKKTKGVCHTRASTLESNITLIHEKQCIINEMRRRRELVHKYEGLLKKLRLKYSTNMSKYINKARLPLMELIWIIIQVMKTKSYTQKMPCVASSLTDFHKNFSITNSTANKLCNMYKISENSALKEAIMVTVMQTLDGELDTNTAKLVYETFEHYPEKDLRVAVEQLRKCTAIAAKEKIFNNQFRKLDLEDISQSSYKISVFYRRRWLCRLNSDFTDKLAEILDTVESVNEIKGSAELNCASCELKACNLLDVEATTVPVIADADGVPISPVEVSAITIDTKYSLKTGTMKWKKKSDTDIIRLHQIENLSESLEHIAKSGTLHVDEIKKVPIHVNDRIITHLQEKAEKGATFKELQDLLGYNEKALLEKLLELESARLICRVGFYENVIILLEYFKSWSTPIVDNYVICTPWLKLPSGVKTNVLLKWSGMVMNTVFEKPGSSIAYISEKCEFITYRAVQDVCSFLEKHKCVILKTIHYPQPDLFSDVDTEPEYLDFNPFHAPENSLVFPTKNCMLSYSYLKKTIIDQFSENDCDVDES